MARFTDGEIDEAEITAMAADAYGSFTDPDVAPLRHLNGDIHVLELFHGPTIAFKDYAMQFLSRALTVRCAPRDSMPSFWGRPAVIQDQLRSKPFRAVTLSTSLSCSRTGVPVQQRQMTSVIADGAHAVAVAGDFDDCQAIVKSPV